MITKHPDEEAIFKVACQIPSPAARGDYLSQVCGDDPAMFDRIQSLLRVYDEESRFLNSPPPGIAATLDTSAASVSVGTLIGPYKLLEQIGEGGMGVVYVAEQMEPVRRRVALKIIKPGMDTKQVIARFEAERQALAMMDHPHIAKVLDAGTTGDSGARDSGFGNRGSELERRPSASSPEPLAPSARPYFVMELVRGLPVTEYCDKARLSPRLRLELFIDVCHAVQHAHQKGVIHRDLKPSNVMVTVHDGRPVAKVIDFGVAKAVGQQLTERTVYTAHTQLVGTPLYMSPEQADFSSQDVDTRSDVYSLGVLLYELLTGQTPFDKETLTKAGFDEMRRIIREDEPPCPSRRFSTLSAQASSTVSQHRSVDERQLGRVLRGELDWIVMKALEKDRSRRYESASSLAADIQRYLSDEPVLACPPTTMYRFQKFARKHKASLTTAAAIAVCLILGTTVSAWQAVRATTAEAQAVANEQKANANQQKANTQRDEVKALYDKLAAKEQQLQRTLYAANMKLAKVAWDEAAIHQAKDLLEQHRPKQGEQDLRGFEWHYLDRLCHAELLTLKGHDAWVYGVAYSVDGKRVASFGNGRVILWDAQTGQELLSLKAQSRGNRGVAFSPDGTRLAIADYDTSYVVKVWDVQTGQELLTMNGGGNGVIFSSDGKRLASGRNGQVIVWDAQTGQELLSLKTRGTGDVTFSPDGKRVATSGGGVKVWDAETGEELLSVKGYHVAFSPDGARLATTNDSGEGTMVIVWDAQSGKQLLSIKGHPSQIRGLAYSPDGKRLATAGVDRLVKVWNSETGEELVTLKGHASTVTNVVFSPNGTRLASTSLDGTVKVWDATSNPEARTFGSRKREISCVTISPDGKRLTIGGPYTWDDFAKNSDDAVLKILDAQTGQELFSVKGHLKPVHSVTYSPDGKLLASGSSDQTVKVWDAQARKELMTFRGHTAPVVSVAFSPDGTRLASSVGDPDGGRPIPNELAEVKVWDAKSGQEVLSLKGHTRFVNCVVFSPDGKRLATHSRDGTVRLWDAETGQEVLAMKTETPRLGHGSVAFSPDGRRLASTGRGGDADAGALGFVKVWDAQTGEELLYLKGHTAEVSSLAYSPDGKRLASASASYFPSGEVKVWDAETGEELLTVKGGSYNHRVAFSPEGLRLASVHSGTLKILDATPLAEKP